MDCNHKYELRVTDISGFTKKVYTYICVKCGDVQIRTSFSPLAVISTLHKDTKSYVKSKTIRKEKIYRKAA